MEEGREFHQETNGHLDNGLNGRSETCLPNVRLSASNKNCFTISRDDIFLAYMNIGMSAFSASSPPFGQTIGGHDAGHDDEAMVGE